MTSSSPETTMDTPNPTAPQTVVPEGTYTKSDTTTSNTDKKKPAKKPSLLEKAFPPKKKSKAEKSSEKRYNKINKKRAYKPSRFLGPLEGFSDRLLENPRLKGTIVTKAIKFIRYAESANKISEKELGIPSKVIFDDEFITQGLSTSSGKVDLVNHDMLSSLHRSVGTEAMDDMMDKTWKRLREIKLTCFDALRFRDLSEFYEQAHDLNETAVSHGMLRLCALGRAMEKASLAHDMPRLRELTKALPAMIDTTRKAYKAWRDTVN